MDLQIGQGFMGKAHFCCMWHQLWQVNWRLEDQIPRCLTHMMTSWYWLWTGSSIWVEYWRLCSSPSEPLQVNWASHLVTGFKRQVSWEIRKKLHHLLQLGNHVVSLPPNPSNWGSHKGTPWFKERGNRRSILMRSSKVW